MSKLHPTVYSYTDSQIEQEISRLQESPNVRLAQRYHEVRAQRIRLLHDLQELEEKGKELIAAGITEADLYEE